MPAFPLRTINCVDIVLVPQNENDLVAAIRNVANSRQQRTLVLDIEKSMKSVRHKISVAMYQAALICDIKPDDFEKFERLEEIGQRPLQRSPAEYKGCAYGLEDIHHYRLLMTLFVETFAATCFSLLDVCGYLLNNLYDLGRNADDTNFYKAYKDLQSRKQNNPDAVFSLVSNYVLENASHVSWLKPLKDIRNLTTHRIITDVCEVQTSHRRGFYDGGYNRTTEFILNSVLFPANSPDKKLRDFVQEVFEGMQEFVEDLYEYLKLAMLSAGSLPLS